MITLQNVKREQREENGRKDKERKIDDRLANIEKISNGMDARLANIEETIKRFVEQAQKTEKSE